MTIIILSFTVLVSAALCHAIAKQRGANPVIWGVMGIVFGPLAIPFVFLAKPVTRESQ